MLTTSLALAAVAALACAVAYGTDVFTALVLPRHGEHHRVG
ncbi:MAG TPA: hypothetical protein VGI55_04230 [Solirubrobacteraceae bacterium]|jgi:hypothetical protein